MCCNFSASKMPGKMVLYISQQPSLGRIQKYSSIKIDESIDKTVASYHFVFDMKYNIYLYLYRVMYTAESNVFFRNIFHILIIAPAISRSICCDFAQWIVGCINSIKFMNRHFRFELIYMITNCIDVSIVLWRWWIKAGTIVQDQWLWLWCCRLVE